jgi:hypothetical protein
MANKKTPCKSKTQRKQRKQRKQRTQRQRQRSQRQRQQRHSGGSSPNDYSLAADTPAKLSLEQGNEFQKMTREYHGGAVFSGAPLTAADSATLDSPMAAAAGVTSLTKAFEQIQGMTDPGVVLPTTGAPAMAGGRRRKGRKASRKGRKHRKASRKSNKGRKASRKHRKTHRRRQGGGGVFAENAATYVKDARDGMLLDNYSGAGLNREWAAVTGASGGDYMGPSA